MTIYLVAGRVFTGPTAEFDAKLFARVNNFPEPRKFVEVGSPE